MPVEGRGLSARQTQQAVRDREIGQPNNSETCSEAADGVARKSEGRSCSCRLVLSQAQTGQVKFAVLSVPQDAGVPYHGGYHGGRNGPKPLDDLSCVVEPAHMRVAGGENAIRLWEAWILLDREEQFWYRLIIAPTEEMRGAYRNERWADSGTRAEAQ